LLPNFWAQGGELVDASGKPVFGDQANRDKFVKAVNYYKDLVNSGAAPKRVLTIKQYQDMEAAAAAGTTALFIGNNGDWGQLKSTMDADAFKNWAFSPLPGPTPDQQASGAGGWVFAALSPDPKKVEFCADVIKEIYNVQANQIMGFLPTESGLYDKYPEFSTPDNKAFAEALLKARTRPGIALYPEISNQIQIMMGDVLSGAKSVDEAVDAAYRASLDAYAKL
jgi:multiple sugar transport system substrate-binding protein